MSVSGGGGWEGSPGGAPAGIPREEVAGRGVRDGVSASGSPRGGGQCLQGRVPGRDPGRGCLVGEPGEGAPRMGLRGGHQGRGPGAGDLGRGSGRLVDAAGAGEWSAGGIPELGPRGLRPGAGPRGALGSGELGVLP